MKQLLIILCLAFAPVALFSTSGCQSQTTLEAGGAYSDVNLAKTDQTILDASHALTGFLEWHSANATYLARWPEVGALAAKVSLQKDSWIRSAYEARDAYASAASAYRAGKGSAPNGNAVNAALSVLTNVTQQVLTYRSAHNV